MHNYSLYKRFPHAVARSWKFKRCLRRQQDSSPGEPRELRRSRRSAASIKAPAARVASPVSGEWKTGGRRGLGSPGGLVFAPAAAERLSAAVAGAQRRVTAHAGRHERQSQQCQPAHAELLLAGVAGARVREISLRVGHAVVQHALGTQHAAHLVDALLDGVGGILALAPPVVLVVEHLAAVNAAGALAVLTPPAGRLRLEQRGRLLGLNWVFAVRARALGIQKLAFSPVRLGEGGDEVRFLALCVSIPKDGVSVVLVASDENVLAGVDADDLLVVHLKADVTRGVEGNLPTWKSVNGIFTKYFYEIWYGMSNAQVVVIWLSSNLYMMFHRPVIIVCMISYGSIWCVMTYLWR